MSDRSPASSISGSLVAPVATPQERRRPGLLARLLVSYVVVVAAGIGTLVVVARLVASPTFDTSIGRVVAGVGMMRGGPGGMDAQMVGLVRAAFTDALGLALPVATAVAAIVAVIAGVALSRWLTAPIRRMVAVSRRIAEGRYDERVVAGQGGEIEELAASFNAMATALEATEQRRIELVGDVAHELRTPLSSLEGYLEGLQDGVVAPTPGTWALLLSHTARLSGLVDDLQELWRADAGQVAFSPSSWTAPISSKRPSLAWPDPLELAPLPCSSTRTPRQHRFGRTARG